MSGMKSLPLPDIIELMNKLPVKYQAILAIGVTTGCRITEILSLRRFDLIARDGKLKDKISFIQLKTRKQKNGKNKVVHRKLSIPETWHPCILRHLINEEQHGYDRPDDYVFRGKCGRPLSRLTVYAVFRSILGEGYGTHFMRKTFSQEMFRFFMDENPRDPMRALELVRRALQHARIDTTVRYLGINEQSIENAQDKIFNKRGTYK